MVKMLHVEINHLTIFYFLRQQIPMKIVKGNI